MQMHVVSANEWLYPDTAIPSSPKQRIDLLVARGARCAAQVLLRPVPVGAKVTATFNGDLGAEVYQLIDVAVDHNTREFGFTVREGDEPAVHVTRQVPFRVYDALKPLRDGAETRAETEALYVQWMMPRDAKPGRHAGTLNIAVGNESVAVPVTIDVATATLPERETLRIVNWFNVGNMASRHGIEPWSEEHWASIRRYGELMRKIRQTDFIPSVGFEVIENSDGTLSFDFSRGERLIKLYLGLGFRWINGPHVATRVTFDAPEFVLRNPRTQVKATGPEGYQFLAQYLSAWYQFLARNGWLDRVVQHVADEPTEKCSEDYRVLSGIVRKFMPGVKIIDALGLTELGGAVDVWVPLENKLNEELDGFVTHQKLGDELWYYTCCIPGGKYLNRLLDMPLIRCRYLHWANQRYGLTGYLHWGLNQYRADQDPFEETARFHKEGGGTEWLPAGDTHVVYPGPTEPWSSVRLEAEAMGAEDYELFRMIAAQDASKAEEIMVSVFRGFQDYSEDVAAFEVAHAALVNGAANAD